MTLSISGDYSVVDNLETVSYYVKTGEGTYSSAITLDNVLRRVQDKVFEDIMLTKNEIVFHIWGLDFIPALNDRIVDAVSIAWTVKDVKVESLQTRYRVLCLKEV